MEEYKSNSHKSKEEKEVLPEKKVEKVISGTARSKKKGEIRKFTDVFISEDIENVKSYVIMDVLIPAVKKAISDIVTNGIDMILYGGSGESSRRTTASKVSYRSYYDKKDSREIGRSFQRARTGYDYDDIILDSYGEAQEVLIRLDELVSTYGMASVADLYDLVGITSNYTDNKYGWTDTRNASVVRTRDGYKIKMPRAIPID